jgi:hypothetical protein
MERSLSFKDIHSDTDYTPIDVVAYRHKIDTLKNDVLRMKENIGNESARTNSSVKSIEETLKEYKVNLEVLRYKVNNISDQQKKKCSRVC